MPVSERKRPETGVFVFTPASGLPSPACSKNRVGKHIAMVEGAPPAASERPKGRLPRITRYMALAIYYDDLIRDYAEIALLGHVTRARVTQIMKLRLRAPDIQEQLVSLERVVEGRDTLSWRRLQSIALESDWPRQRKSWQVLQRR